MERAKRRRGAILRSFYSAQVFSIHDSGSDFGMLEVVFIKALYVLFVLSTAALVWVAGAVYLKVRQHMVASQSCTKRQTVLDGEPVSGSPTLPIKEGRDV